MKIIQTENLSKYYGKARGIIDMNLSVEGGDIFGFIGPNGAGKSTTIRTLLGLISPTSGSARIFDKDILKDHIEILSRIGYMPSEAMFYHGMRVEEVLRLSASLHGKNCRDEAHRLCERFKLDTKKKVEELSLGNRKKVSIVCAFMHQPDLYILDEPTSGLDPLMQKAFFELIHEKNKQGAHYFSLFPCSLRNPASLQKCRHYSGRPSDRLRFCRKTHGYKGPTRYTARYFLAAPTG